MLAKRDRLLKVASWAWYGNAQGVGGCQARLAQQLQAWIEGDQSAAHVLESGIVGVWKEELVLGAVLSAVSPSVCVHGVVSHAAVIATTYHSTPAAISRRTRLPTHPALEPASCVRLS
jgi:hypothetical protein